MMLLITPLQILSNRYHLISPRIVSTVLVFAPTLIDGLGYPLKFILSPGQRNDIVYAEALIKDATFANVLADKGYNSNHLIEIVQKQNCLATKAPSQTSKRL